MLYLHTVKDSFEYPMNVISKNRIKPLLME